MATATSQARRTDPRLYLNEHGPRGPLPGSELRRFTIELDGGGVRSEPLAEGSVELARAEAPHHIPFGFHGQYFR